MPSTEALTPAVVDACTASRRDLHRLANRIGRAPGLRGGVTRLSRPRFTIRAASAVGRTPPPLRCYECSSRGQARLQSRERAVVRGRAPLSGGKRARSRLAPEPAWTVLRTHSSPGAARMGPSGEGVLRDREYARVVRARSHEGRRFKSRERNYTWTTGFTVPIEVRVA